MFYIDLDLELYSPGGEEFLREIASACAVNKQTKVLEVGASAAFSARFLAKNYGCRTVATDINAAWLPVIERRAKRDGVGERVAAKRADVLSLSFPANSFDLVLANGVLYFTDKHGGLLEMARVLKKGGKAAVGEPLWLKEPPFRLRRAVEWDGEARVETEERYDQLFEETGLELIYKKVYPSSFYETYYKPAQARIEKWRESGHPLYTKYGAEIDVLLEEIALVRQFGRGVLGYGLFVGEKRGVKLHTNFSRAA